MAINDISLTAGMRSNLLSLQGTVDLLNRTQNRLSSGKKVNTALDNPVSFFASQALTSRASVIDGLKDAMGQAVQTITAADKGITAISSMIEQAKGIAQSALSADAGLGTETVTLAGLTAGDTITIGGTTLTAGSSSTTTTTTVDDFTITFANAADVGDTINVGGISFSATAANTVSITQFSLDLNVNTLVAGNEVEVGGVSYTAVASSYTTVYDSFAVDMTGVVATDEITVGAATYTAVGTTAGMTSTQFYVGDNAADAATNLRAAIGAHQAGSYNVAAPVGNSITITAGSSPLGAATVSSADVTVTRADHQDDITALTLNANEFVISGDAGMDASNLRAVINGLQGANYTAAGAGAVVTIVGDGATTLDAGSVVLTPAAGIAVSTTTATTATVLGQFEFAVGADANATAASLAGKLQTFFGAQLGVANASSSSVITITPGTQLLSATTVTTGTDADSDMTIASSSTVTTTPVYADGYFAVTGVNTTDAATLSNAINSAAITGFTATASDGVLTIANSTASVTTNDVVVTGGHMTEAMIAAGDDTELAALQAQYTEMLNQINTIAIDAGYKGKNLLDGDVLTVKFEGSHSLVITGFNVEADLGIAQAAAWNAGGNIDADITKLDDALVTLRSESSKLSGNLSIISVRQDFSKNMINTLTEGADKLTLADTNEEGANMLMLQTRQSLSTTALSLSAQAAQSVLKLFG